MRPTRNSSRNLHLKDCSYTRNGKKYPYYAIAESVFEGGKRQKRILKTLHSLTPAEVVSYRYMLKCVNSGEISIADMQDVVFEQKKDFLNVSLMHSLWERLELSKPFTYQGSSKELSTARLVEILTLSKLLKPSSNVKTVDWFQRTLLPEILGINAEKYNSMKIFHELSLIRERKEQLEEHLVGLAQNIDQNEFKLYFIDGTTTFFEGTECPLGKSGKDKTHGFKTHMILILLLTDRHGYPCAWDVYDGRQKEITHFKTLANRLIKKYKIENVTFCFDRGFASEENFKLAESLGFNFISGIDSNQIQSVFDPEEFVKNTREKLIERSKAILENSEKDKQKKASARKLVPINGFYTADGDRFYRDLGIVEKYRYIAGFSMQVYEAQQKQRQNQQMKVFLNLCEINQELLGAKKDRDLDVLAKKLDRILEDASMQAIIEYQIVPITVENKKQPIQSAKIHYSVNHAEWLKASLLDGLFVYITDLTKRELKTDQFLVSAYDIIQHYKAKNIIESDFKKLKHVIDLRPVYVRLEEHVHAHVAVCILGQFLNVYIERKLKTIDLSLLTFYDLLEQSSTVAVLKTGAQTYRKLIQTHNKMKEALEVLGYTQALPADLT